MSALSLVDAKLYLGITNTTNDTELQTFIDAAEASIGNRCGPLASTAVTYRATGGKSALVLPVAPVISLTSVTPVGAGQVALDITKLQTLPWGGVEYLDGVTTFSNGFYDVSYLAGRVTVPADLLMAVKEHVRHLWDTQRGSVRRPGQEAQQPTPGAAYAFTWRVNELMAPHLQGGFA